MDLRSDTYFCLDPASSADLTSPVRNRREFRRGDPRLEALGIANEPVELVRADARRPGHSLVDSATRSPPRLTDVARIALLLRNTRDQLGRRPIEECLIDLVSDPPHRVADNGDDWLVRSERFLRARKLVPLGARDRCLLDSVALLRWLGDLRSRAALVFGVKLDPFAAHCWVQADDLVLNDRLENVAAFTPVRSISCSDATQ